MALKKQEKKIKKVFGIKRFINSIKYSFDGLCYAYNNEQSTRMHAVGFFAVIIIGLLLQISFVQWSLVLLSSLFILSIELINTAIEATVDMVTKEYNDYAKIAKDCGSAAAFIASIAHIGICTYVLVDNLIKILG